MKYWPVPNSYSKDIPIQNKPGSFWEDRGDRKHCGVDIYAPKGSKVLSIEDGTVLKKGLFTSPNKTPYWNITYFVLIQNHTGLVCKYAELEDVIVKSDDLVKAGQIIGHVGRVLNSRKIDQGAPLYIQKIKKNKNESMLHFELYNMPFNKKINYSGGNLFDSIKPEFLMNPTNYLRSIKNK